MVEPLSMEPGLRAVWWGCVSRFRNATLWIDGRTEVAKLTWIWLWVTILSLTSCSGPTHVHMSGGQGNDAALALTLRAIPLASPPNASLLSFSATIVGVSLTASTGESLNVPLNSPVFQIDFAKLQSDTTFLSLAMAIPPGTYTNVVVGLANPVVVFCKQAQVATGCEAGSVTTLTGAPAAPIIDTAPFPLALAHGQTTGLAIVLNLAHALAVNAQTKEITNVNLSASDVMTALMLPPTSSTLPPGTVDFIDDVLGVVSSVDPAAQSVTVQTATRGSIKATAGPLTIVSPNCTTFHLGNTFACAKQSQVASLDMTLNADGTFSLLEYDPLATTAGDWIEGLVVQRPSSASQFQLIVNDLVVTPSSSLIGGNLGLGDPVTINLINPKPFRVDSKGLIVPNSAFNGASDASVLQPGETLAVHVVGFAPSSPGSLGIASADVVYLRFTRATGTVAVTAPPNTFTMQSFPSFFGLTMPVSVQLSSGLPKTHFDGINGASSLVSGQIISIAALYFGPPSGPTPTPTPFSAAKVRVH